MHTYKYIYKSFYLQKMLCIAGQVSVLKEKIESEILYKDIIQLSKPPWFMIFKNFYYCKKHENFIQSKSKNI